MFEKSSLRTRLSFYLAIKQLGGGALNIKPDELHLKKEEKVYLIQQKFYLLMVMDLCLELIVIKKLKILKTFNNSNYKFIESKLTSNTSFI